MASGEKFTSKQWVMLVIESLGWSGVMVMGYFFASYYALIQHTFEYTPAQIANLTALMSASGAVCYLLGGVIADMFKPKVNLTIAYLGLTACGIVVMMKPSYTVMCVVAVLVSFFGLGMFVSTMLKYVASLGSREQMPRMYGYFYMLAAIESLAVAPITSAVISRSGSYVGLCSIIAFFCGMMLFSWLVHIFWVEKHTKLELSSNDDSKFSFKLIPQVLKDPNMYYVMIIACVTLLPYDLNTFVQPLLASQFKASQSLIAFVASYANNGTALIFAPLAGIIAAKLGSTSKVMAMSQVLAIASTVALLFTPWEAKYVVVAVAIVFALRSVMSIGKPARNSMVGESRLPRKARGTVIGLMFALSGVQSTIVAKAAGSLMTNYQGAEGYRILYSAGLAIFVVGLFVCMAFTRRLRKAKERDAINGAPKDLMI